MGAAIRRPIEHYYIVCSALGGTASAASALLRSNELVIPAIGDAR